VHTSSADLLFVGSMFLVLINVLAAFPVYVGTEQSFGALITCSWCSGAMFHSLVGLNKLYMVVMKLSCLFPY
jgi:hypothetical protein